MGFFDRAFGTLGASWAPDDDRWYGSPGSVSTAGVRITAEGAQKVSAFYRGVDLLSTSLAMLPFNVYRKLPDEQGAETAKDHPLYDVIHRKPNGWQNSFEWRRLSMRHLILKGNAYSRIVEGRRGFVDQLWPMSPDRIKPEQLSSGRIVYHEQLPNGTRKTWTQDEILHLRGVTDDGITGVGIVQWAKDSLGLAMATESYAARLFSQGPLYGTVLTVPTRPDKELQQSYQDQFRAMTGGLQNAHSLLVGWGGGKFEKAALTGEETQFIQSRKFSIDDIARWLGVPPHMIGSLERSTNNNIEHQGQEFVTYSLGPWLTLFEQASNDQLILRPDQYFCEFVRDALVRGDIATRWAAYHTGVTDGTVTRNEVRRKENMRALPGLDEPLTPAHIVGKQDPAPARRAQSAPPAEPEPEPRRRNRAEMIAQQSAARLLRKEIAAVQKAAVRFAADEDQFVEAITEFYSKHVELVTQTLLMSEDDAKTYCAGQAHQIINGNWIDALELWRAEDYAAGVAAIALEEAA